MALINVSKRCDDCQKTREAIEELRSEVRRALLDYEDLYEKVRTNLGKLAKRARMDSNEPSNGDQGSKDSDPLARYREALVARKLGKGI